MKFGPDKFLTFDLKDRVGTRPKSCSGNKLFCTHQEAQDYWYKFPTLKKVAYLQHPDDTTKNL